MCGILGIAAPKGVSVGVSDAQASRMRDLMAHRGPDGHGLWRESNILLGHRRLAILDPTPAGAQPMLSEPGAWGAPPDRSRFALVYNGELYNDADLRRDLAALGHRFRTSCDTETVLHAFAAWGAGALPRLRGMFALGLYDSRLELLTLARDPLGVKPLYYARIGRELVFASEARPILAHPGATAAPDPVTLSAYLTTIRTTLGPRTLFKGVSTLQPGHVLECDLGAPGGIVMRERAWWRGPRTGDRSTATEDAAEAAREAITDTVERQLRSDVPLCTLLSGGLDSTIISAIARRRVPGLMTFCAGSPVPGDCREDPGASDLCWARKVSDALGTRHAEATVTAESFAERWPWIIERLGAPLSTPNEVAIHAVAERLRADGCVVTLSGEGADELFAGYEGPLDQSARFLGDNQLRSPWLFELEACAWAPLDAKQALLSPDLWSECGQDAPLIDAYQREYEAAVEESGTRGLDAHTRLQRRINLTGLLQRLDSATMLASVEGRTPFADASVAALAESLPMERKYEPPSDDADELAAAGGSIGAASRVAARPRTKLVLRHAFEGLIPGSVLDRPKSSFPLPFQGWVGSRAADLRASGFARAILSAAAIEAVSEHPGRLWHLAWPMINLAMWGRAQGWD